MCAVVAPAMIATSCCLPVCACVLLPLCAHIHSAQAQHTTQTAEHRQSAGVGRGPEVKQEVVEAVGSLAHLYEKQTLKYVGSRYQSH